MKKFTLLLVAVLALITVAFTACTQGDRSGASNIVPNEPLTGESKVLVAYFSWSSSNNTQKMAEFVAEATGGETFRLYPDTPYTTNYSEVLQIAREEQTNDARPTLGEDISEEVFAEYDVIFIGYPIWYYDAPMIIYTFLEAHDFTGKTIVPFATSGGSGLEEEADFARLTGATVLDGLCISDFSATERNRQRVESWISQLGYMKVAE